MKPPRRATNERGSTLVEMALVTPLFLWFLLGIIEFGMMINAYVTVQHAAREGVRLGITGADDSAIVARVEAAAIPLQPSLIDVTVTPAEDLRERGEPLTVAVSYEYTLMTPLVSSIAGSTITISSALDMRME